MVIKTLEQFVELATGYPALHALFKQAIADEQWELAASTRKILDKQYFALQIYRRQFERAKRYGDKVYTLPIEFVR